MTVNQYITRIENGLANVGKVLLFVLMMLIFMNAVMRYVFDSPVTGVIQLIEDYILIGIVFLLLSTVEYEQDHIKVDILVDRIPNLPRKAIYIISSIATIGIFAYSIRAYLQVSYSQWQSNALSGYWNYPIAPARVLIAFGLTLLCVRLGHNIWREFSDG